MTTRTEEFEAKLDDGTVVIVVRESASMPEHGDMDVLPTFAIAGGERLTPVGDDLLDFVGVETRRHVRIVGPRPGS